MSADLNNSDKFLKCVAKYHDCLETYNLEIDLSDKTCELIDILINFYAQNISELIPMRDSIETTIENIDKGSKYLKDNFSINNINYFKNSDDFKEFEEKIKKIHGDGDFSNLRRYLLYRNSVSKVSPFSVKTSVVPKEKIEAYTKFVFPYINSNYILDPFVDRIYINSENSNTADFSIIHEIAHTQLESKKNAYHNLFNMETISMILELIYAYDYCSDRKLFGAQVGAVGDFINFSEYMKDNSLINKIYFYSKYCSLELFAIYKTNPPVEKGKMKSYIQDIFDGKMSVEDLLEQYNICFNSPDKDVILRSLKK